MTRCHACGYTGDLSGSLHSTFHWQRQIDRIRAFAKAHTKEHTTCVTPHGAEIQVSWSKLCSEAVSMYRKKIGALRRKRRR